MNDLAKYVQIVCIVSIVEFLFVLPLLLHSEYSSKVSLNREKNKIYIRGIQKLLINERSINNINYRNIYNDLK